MHRNVYKYKPMYILVIVCMDLKKNGSVMVKSTSITGRRNTEGLSEGRGRALPAGRGEPREATGSPRAGGPRGWRSPEPGTAGGTGPGSAAASLGAITAQSPAESTDA